MTVDRFWFAAIVLIVLGSVLLGPILVVFIAARDRYERSKRRLFTESIRCLECGQDIRNEREAKCNACGATFVLDDLWAHRPR